MIEDLKSVSRITFQTKAGNLIDLVWDKSDAISEYYIQFGDIEKLLEYFKTFEVPRVTYRIMKKFLEQGLVKMKKEDINLDSVVE